MSARKSFATFLGIAAMVASSGSCGDSTIPDEDAANETQASYVGRQSCASCHQQEVDAWSDSHHDLAMQQATDATVLGDFDDATFTHFGVTSTFSRGDNGSFVVRTEGSDGELADFDVAFAFGVEPLQQYLIEFPNGRYQALSIAWDSRPEAEGGQRWFHLYPDEQIESGDALHWTGPAMTWNYQCAECHSTNLRKNYDQASGSYATTWSEMDVSCEACHGPGSTHVELAQGWTQVDTPTDLGLSGAMADPGGGWLIALDESIAARSVPLPSNEQVETCAHCHARRATIEEGRVAGSPLHDSDIVSRLEPGLYHADGQILDEVYLYGSFVQSSMYQAGVRCSDCHDPHSLELRAPGNDVCAGCHLPSSFDTAEHHNHPANSTGAQCVECHMPETTYMVVDPRRDHSMRIPRPRLSESLGVPNACNSCHVGESVAWSVAAVEDWYGPAETGTSHFAEALDAGWNGMPGADSLLRRVASTPEQPGIVRATALALAGAYRSIVTLVVIRDSSTDPDPMVRLGALAALEAYPAEARPQIAFRMLRDTIRAVRIEAARVLAPVTRGTLSPQQRSLLDSVTAEYVRAQAANADHPSAHVNIANLYGTLGVPQAAEQAFRDALAIDSTFVPAYLNLADLYRAALRDGDAEATLLAGLQIAPENAGLHHSMGLVKARIGELAEARRWLTEAVALAPDEPRFAYVLAVAMNSEGDSDSALSVLVSALERRPYNRELLTLLVQLHRDRGELATAVEYGERLLAVAPDDPSVRQLLSDLDQPRR